MKASYFSAGCLVCRVKNRKLWGFLTYLIVIFCIRYFMMHVSDCFLISPCDHVRRMVAG